MFTVDEATAEAIRRAYDEGGELSGIGRPGHQPVLEQSRARPIKCAMSNLLWTYRDGALSSHRPNGLELLVAPAQTAGEYRYELRCRAKSSEVKVCVASGHHGDVREAIAAAERRA